MTEKLTLNHQANLFILSTQQTIQRKKLHTPFGIATPVYVNSIMKPPKQSEYGTESYRASLSRAFNRAKQQIYFNPDMTKFITLTYAENMQDMDKLLYDIKYMVKQQKRETAHKLKLGLPAKQDEPKYLFVVEQQKRGAYHVHMIANDFLDTYINNNGHPAIQFWPHGIGSILDIKNADTNFKPYLYLFKYMKKAQRLGKSFVHASRNLNNFTELTSFEFDKKVHNLQFRETTNLGYIDKTITKLYYKKGSPESHPPRDI